MLTIGQLSQLSGFPASTLRYYDKIGLLRAANRVSKQRRYAENAVNRLAVIRLAQNAGFQLMEIRRLFSGFEPGAPASARWRQMATGKLAELQAKERALRGVRTVLVSLLGCRCGTLEECGAIASRVLGSGS